MGDRAYTEIRFGGRLPSSALPRLRELVDGYCEYAEPAVIAETAGFDPRTNRPVEGQPVTLTDIEANYGRVSEVEAFCREHRLPYVSHHQTGGEYGEGIDWYDPDKHPAEDTDDYDTCAAWEAEPVVYVNVIRGLIERHGQGPLFHVALRDLLDANTPPEVPPLVIVPEVGDRVRFRRDREDQWTKGVSTGRDDITGYHFIAGDDGFNYERHENEIELVEVRPFDTAAHE